MHAGTMISGGVAACSRLVTDLGAARRCDEMGPTQMRYRGGGGGHPGGPGGRCAAGAARWRAGDGGAALALAFATAQLLSPFTGEPVPSLNRVLAVKIDNIVYARPQTGLTHADIVYVLPVEGGLSRFLAVFSSHYPPVIGPGAQRAGGRPGAAAPVRPAQRSPTRAPRPRCCPTSSGPPGS